MRMIFICCTCRAQVKNIRKQCVAISHVNSQAMSVSRQSLRSLLGASPNPREHLHKQMSYAIKNRYHTT